MADDDNKNVFRGFGDLKKSLGGGESKDGGAGAEEPESKEEKGWSLETDEDANAEADLDLESLGAPIVNERVAARPAAFGPMEHGPPPYRDPESEEMELLHSFRVRTIFPEDVLGEVGSLPTDPEPKDFEGREDLREEMIFTIDGDDAKDYDDAIGIKDLGEGRLEIGVHIADVAHYVRPGTALDEEALCRGTSVYVADQVIPMLPEAISNHLCSLVPDRDRLAFSVTMVFDAKGQRESARVHKSVIRSKKRNTYRGVQELLDGKDTERAREIEHLRAPLELFAKWTRVQQGIRDAKGSMRIDSRERKFVFDDKHEVCEIVFAEKYFSMTLIEETALAANQAVGDLFRKRGLPTIYRVHPEKDPEEIEAVAKLLEQHGIRVPAKERLTGRDIGRMIRAARRRANAEALIQRIMGLVERAVYEVKDHQDVAQHFGLAREAYLHFTSPIRRYPDLMVHRWLWSVESQGPEAAHELRTEQVLEELNDTATHSSAQADVAGMVESAVGDLKVCQFMHPHIGEKMSAKVHRVSRYGIELTIPEKNVQGFLPAKQLGDRIEVKGPTMTVKAGRRHLSFQEGHPIAVLLEDVDFIRLQLLFTLAS